MDLTSALTWIISGGGAAWFGWWLCNHVSWLVALTDDYKRYAAYGLTAIIAVAAWAMLTAGTGEPWPVGWWAWPRPRLLAARWHTRPRRWRRPARAELVLHFRRFVTDKTACLSRAPHNRTRHARGNPAYQGGS